MRTESGSGGDRADTPTPGASPDGAIHTNRVLVARNALWFLLSQVLNAPVSIVISGLIARRLGPAEYGDLYVASSLIGLAAMVGEFGQGAALPAAVARAPGDAPKLVGSAVSLRLSTAVVAHAALAGCAILLRYDRPLVLALCFLTVQTFLGHLGSSATGTARGFERGRLVARNGILGQLLNAGFVIPTILLGGKLVGILAAQLTAAVFQTVIDWRLLRTLAIKASFRGFERVKDLAREGGGFLLLSVVLVLPPNIDAVLLSKMVPHEVIGWHAAATRLLGVAVFPASAVGNALYPSLCRLRTESPAEMTRSIRSALGLVSLIAVPIALGFVFYPQLGIKIFSRASFGAAESNIRLFAPFIVLVYVSMVLGTYINAIGRQYRWAGVQLASVLVTAVLDPVLIPHFQATRGNGALGVCLSCDLSEALLVIAGMAMVPRDMFDRTFWRSTGGAVLSGGVMALSAWRLRFANEWLAAILSVLAYAAALLVTKTLTHDHLEFVRAIVRRRRPAS